MKRTLLTTALLVGISGLATAATTAATDGFVVEATHPHEETSKTETHNVWVQKVSDGEHMYELHMDGGEMIVIVDGETIPNDQIEKKGNAVVVMEDDGGVIYEFNIALSTDRLSNKNTNKPMVFMTHDDQGNIAQWVGEDGGDRAFITDGRVSPKVMLGVYTGEPGDSLREHLGIKGDAILVERVIKGLSADKAGIKDKDIIISIDGSDGLSSKGLTELLSKHNPGDEIKIVVVRKGEKMKLPTKLHAYDAEALGHTKLPGGGTWVGEGDPGNLTFAPLANRFFSKETQQLTHEKILEALREEGISEDKIREIKEQIGTALHDNVWSQFGHDGQGGIIDFHVETGDQAQGAERRFFAEQMQRKASDAMRDAERLTMEFKDGQLLLKRHAEGLENHLHELEGRLHESLPEIEEEFDNRLEELEGRLEELEVMLDKRMDRLSGLIEHLIQRLEED